VFRLLCDHDLNEAIVVQLEEKAPDLDIVRAREEGLARTKDPQILAWAADNDRIVLSHDRNTMTRFAYERVRAGERMCGLFVIEHTRDIGRVISDILDVTRSTAPRGKLSVNPCPKQEGFYRRRTQRSAEVLTPERQNSFTSLMIPSCSRRHSSVFLGVLRGKYQPGRGNSTRNRGGP
jgi:hypothetical protein